ncbi:MAG: RES domain-containing protein, partial [Vulcanimicrobiaceae bacterium]
MRNRELTQSWARRVYESRNYAGVTWWSYYNPDWRSVAIWDLRNVNVGRRYEPLAATHQLVKNAAAAIVRQIDPGSE